MIQIIYTYTDLRPGSCIHKKCVTQGARDGEAGVTVSASSMCTGGGDPKVSRNACGTTGVPRI
jgi:hypothetical protein